MSMNAKCIAAVRAAAGNRRISDGKINKIADKLDETLRQLAREDRALPPNNRVWMSLTKDQQVSKGAERAMQEVQAEAALIEHRAALQVLRAAERDADMQKTMDRDKATVSQAAIMEMERTGMRAEAIKDESLGGLVDMLDAVTAKDGVGVMRRVGMAIFDLDNPAMTRDVVREIFRNADGSTGNATAKKGAAAWLKTIENARTRFNAAGGSVGKLSYGYLGHLWDSVAVGKIDADRFAKAMLGRVGRERYLRPDGSLMNDAEVTDLLKAAHETIKTEGDNKTLPGQFKGDGARANRGSDHRVIHFKDGDSWMDAMGEFGQGSLYDAMLGHIGRVSKDIALVEQFGPNPAAWAKMQFDLAHRADGEGTVKNRGFGTTPEARWSILSGEASTPANETIAHTGNALRNLQVAAKLGGAVISSMTDIATVLQTLHYDRLPMFDFARSLSGQTFSADQRRWLTTQGIVAESLANSINRFTGEHLTSSLSGRVASSVMKVSFMNAWTNGLRRAFSMTMMHGFERKLGKTWQQLDEWDRFLMEKKGINESDWGVITQAQASEFGGRKYLTPESVRAVSDAASDASTKWHAFVSDEAQFAVIGPDQATRALTTWGGMQAGTINGEAARAFGQFKSFPIAMLSRHHRRIWQTPQGLEGAPSGFGAESAGGAAVNRLAVMTGLMLTSTLLGGMVLQTKSMLQGKDPYDMTEPRWWMRAMAQGGGLGYFGDLLFKDPTENRGGTVEQTVGVVAGPVAGTIAGVAGDLVVINAWEAAKGKETHAGAEALRLLSSNTPYGNLWQTRGLVEHWFLHNAQEAVNPGYLGRMQQRAMKDWHQGYWWEPGEAVPDRGPDIGRAFGQ